MYSFVCSRGGRTLKRLACIAAAAMVCGSINAAEKPQEASDAKKNTFRDYILERTHLSGYGQAGWHYDSYDAARGGAFNAFDLYRAMFVVSMEPVDKLYIGFMADIVNFKLHEYYGEYRPFSFLKVKFGQFKTPFSIENNMSPSVLELIRGSAPVQYLAGINGSDACFGAGAGRDLGLMVSGDFLPAGRDRHFLFGYSVGVFSGEPFNTKETNRYKDIAAMLSVSPLKNLKFVGSFYSGMGTARADSPYGVFVQGDVYRRSRWSAGFDWKTGPVYARGEYLEGVDADVRSRGAYLTLTGHTCRFLDVIASADYLDTNISVGDWQCNYAAGLQWNIARKCRLQLQYIYQHRAPEHRAGPSSHLVVSQLQLGF